MADETERDFIPVVEETATVSTRRVVSGRVRIATQTEEINHLLPTDLASVEVDVVRVPMDRRIDTIPDVVTEGEVTIIPVVEERLVVTRELYLREEIHVHRIEHKETIDVPATTRRQTVQIERLPADLEQPYQKDDQDDL
ncbi:YsnF/AvaK domain-containing protein [Paracoccus sp. 22332]|uniref:YsnF/AvaK domain-containing protein n=1 Tax=Paracoccus sp. 22332 TaxID=3453913 RepID=UPI003F8546C7